MSDPQKVPRDGATQDWSEVPEGSHTGGGRRGVAQAPETDQAPAGLMAATSRIVYNPLTMRA